MRRVRVVWSGVAGSPAYSNFYAVTGDSNGDTFHAAVSQLIADLAAYVVNEVTAVVQAEVPLIDSVTGKIQGVALLPPQTVTGQAQAEMLPPSNNMMIKWGTDDFVGGRRVVGRTNIPYLEQSVNENGVVNPLVISGLSGALSEYILNAGNDAVVWAKTSGGAAQIQTATIDQKFSIIRSRRD